MSAPDRPAWRRGTLGGLAHDLVEPHVLGLRRGLIATGEVDQVADQQRQLLDLRDHLGEQLLAVGGVDVGGLLEDLDVGAQAGYRRAQLVGGVGDELALGAHGGVERADRALQRVEHRVEAHRQASDLVGTADLLGAGGVDPLGEVPRARDVLGGAREAPDGSHDSVRHEPPEQRRQRDPAQCDQREHHAQMAQQATVLDQVHVQPVGHQQICER